MDLCSNPDKTKVSATDRALIDCKSDSYLNRSLLLPITSTSTASPRLLRNAACPRRLLAVSAESLRISQSSTLTG